MTGTRRCRAGISDLNKRGVRISNRLPPGWYPEACLFEIPLGRIQSYGPFLRTDLSTILADRRAMDIPSTIARISTLAQG